MLRSRVFAFLAAPVLIATGFITARALGQAPAYQHYKIIVIDTDSIGAERLEKELNQGGWKMESFHLSNSPAHQRSVAILRR
jgi:hypothetical protein